MAENIYPKGIRTFKKHDNAPEFVLGTVVITLKELRDWALDDGSLSLKVDTWKPTNKTDKES